MLLTREDIRRLVLGVGPLLPRPVHILVVGGAAVLALCPEGSATRDIDAMRTEDIDVFLDAVRKWSSGEGSRRIDVNTRSDAFEVYFPEDWRERVSVVDDLSTPMVQVLVPSPEDLAIAKVFRFGAKDADDIALLAALPGFDRQRFREGFLNVLPVAIGNKRWHAQSFAMAWNRLWPDSPVDAEDLVRAATA